MRGALAPRWTPGGSLPRLLAGIHAHRPVSLAEHHRLHGALPRLRPGRAAELVELLEQSGLRGRGGGRFSTADKLSAVAAQRRRAIVLVNALEGEPVSGKDKVLLRHAPQLVLDGAMLAATSLGASKAIIAVGQTSKAERLALADAVAARRPGVAAEEVPLSIAAVPSGFVSGEETAIVHYLNRGEPRPTMRPPLPHERGVDGAPTLVLNAETSAHVALITRFGSPWFRQLGTAVEPGSMLLTVSGGVQRPGVYEVALATPLRKVIERAGGFTERPKALLLGGYFGTWVPVASAAELTLADESFAGVGARLGAGAIVVLPESACAVVETARVVRYLAGEGAGQCGPCVHGLAAASEVLERLGRRSRGRFAGNECGELTRIVGLVEGRGACRHPDGVAHLIRSALATFPDEFAEHVAGRCSRRNSGVLPVTQRRS